MTAASADVPVTSASDDIALPVFLTSSSFSTISVSSFASDSDFEYESDVVAFELPSDPSVMRFIYSTDSSSYFPADVVIRKQLDDPDLIQIRGWLEEKKKPDKD